jgi:hypothetical protein
MLAKAAIPRSFQLRSDYAGAKFQRRFDRLAKNVGIG